MMMVTRDDIYAGTVPDDLIRLPGICRLLAVPLGRRAEAIAWLEAHCPPVEPHFNGPLHLRPQAGAYRLRELAAAVRAARAKNRLPSFFAGGVGPPG